jgi:hypothetical protein
MTERSSAILACAQKAPGRWTIDQLCTALGLPTIEVVLHVNAHIKAGRIEPASGAEAVADLDPAPGLVRRRHTFAMHPTITTITTVTTAVSHTGTWITPGERPRP